MCCVWVRGCCFDVHDALALLAHVQCTHPTPRRYCAFVWGVPSVVVGQPVEYSEFHVVCNGEQAYGSFPPWSRFGLVARKLAIAMAFLVAHLWGFERFQLAAAVDPHAIAVARSSVLGFLSHLGYLYAATAVVRFMFYSVTYFTDAVSIIAGFGYRVRLYLCATSGGGLMVSLSCRTCPQCTTRESAGVDYDVCSIPCG